MSAYPAFDAMPIGARWRAGRSGKTRASTDPYTGATLAEIAQADQRDLTEAYDSAVAAQQDWADEPPSERAGVMRAAADVMTDAGGQGHRGEGRREEAGAGTRRQRAAVIPATRTCSSGRSSIRLSWRAFRTSSSVPATTVLLGGDPFGPTGLCLPPHVLAGGNAVATAREEVFGPVITVLRADGEQDALRLANDTEYGLSSAVFSRDVDRAVRFGRRIRAGMTHVNDSPVNDDANTAFGGVKDSGVGRFGGQWAVDEFTTDHWVSVQHQPRRYAI